MARPNPSSPDIVAERIARLTTDPLVTRRGYLRILAVLSGGLAAGNLAVALGAFRRRTQGTEAQAVVATDADAIPVGGSVRFSYPGGDDPAVLLRVDEQTFVAYSAVCTHLACEVLWQPDDRELYCPCHDGRFDPASGRPVGGPPTRPLPGITLERRGRAIIARGEAPVGEE